MNSIQIKTNEVFMSWRFFPITWEEAVSMAKHRKLKYIDFNGFIFDVDIKKLDYNKAICAREDLKDE